MIYNTICNFTIETWKLVSSTTINKVVSRTILFIPLKHAFTQWGKHSCNFIIWKRWRKIWITIQIEFLWIEFWQFPCIIKSILDLFCEAGPEIVFHVDLIYAHFISRNWEECPRWEKSRWSLALKRMQPGRQTLLLIFWLEILCTLGEDRIIRQEIKVWQTQEVDP